MISYLHCKLEGNKHRGYFCRNCILEDFMEVGLQFFYFEKFSFMPNDMFVYLNAIFMIYKALELTVRMIIEVTTYWNLKERFW